MAEVTQEQVLNALRVVQDPDLHQDIVKLGFVKEIRICDGNVAFDIELTTPACPVKDKLKAEAEAAVKNLPGVKNVEVKMTAQVRNSQPTGMDTFEGLKEIKNLIAVSSGKGGVGKSTVAVNLALALAKTGAKVGLMDADVYGPSVPKMLASNERPGGKEGKIFPVERYGIKFMSMALLTDATSPVIWRGPMATKLIQQFLGQVLWGELDYLLIDLPPGTGDVQLTLTQSAPLTGAVIVTTPQEVAVSVTMRGIKMFEQVQVPILGMIENMSGFVCPHCDQETPIFLKGGGKRTAEELGFRYLGGIPLDPKLALAGDAGRPVVDITGEGEPISSHAFMHIAKEVASQVSIVTAETSSVRLAPTKIENDEKDLIIEWSDQHTSRFPFRKLRLSCPCAECIDEWTGKPRLKPETVPQDVHPVGFRPVGRYGLQISWSDGHGSGIFTFNAFLDIEAGEELPTSPSALKKGNGEAKLKDEIIEGIKTIFDPEIPVNIYELGLIYDVAVDPQGVATIKMTLTAPACPAAEILPGQVETKAKEVDGVKDAKVELTFDPPWSPERMSEAARVQLGL